MNGYIGEDFVGKVARQVMRRGGIAARPPLPAQIDPTAVLRNGLGLGFDKISDTDSVPKTLRETLEDAFQATRLIIDSVDDGTTTILLVTEINVGTQRQSAGLKAQPASAYGRDATGVMVQFQPARAGTSVSVVLATSATPATGKTVTFSGVMLGRMVR